MTATSISAQEFSGLCRGGAKVNLLDVRTPAEFEEAHLTLAKNIPLDRLDLASVQATFGAVSDGPLYVVCQKGSRGKQACDKLRQAGLENVVNIDGGTLACIDAGAAVTRGRKTMSLERQVRIAAGSLVLAGVVLGWFWQPAFFGLSAFVGAGLVFAGITDTCGMGMLLAKAPWNQRPATTACN